jgi:hypothetical protein
MLPDRAYWVVPGKFMAGAYPGSKVADEALVKGKKLLDCGIRRVISLMEAHEVGHSGEAFVPYGEPLCGLAKDQSTVVSLARFPIRDMDVPTSKTMTSVLDEIDQSIAAGQPVYVHCWGGRGRTGTVVGCYLVRNGLEGEEALRRITELRRELPDAHMPSPETEAQRQMVSRWAD